jgi:DNA topoisomerase-3
MQLNGYRGKVSRLWLRRSTCVGEEGSANILPGEKTLPIFLQDGPKPADGWRDESHHGLDQGVRCRQQRRNLALWSCQTPVLALVVRRERPIAAFVPKSHFGVNATALRAGIVPMAWMGERRFSTMRGVSSTAVVQRRWSSRSQGRPGR